MEAIILAGGFGTRLSHIVKDIPKPMAPVADEPFLKHIFKYLRRNKITKVILATGYKSEMIEEYFKDNYHGIQIVYSVENEPLGTGGAIKKALEFCDDDNVFLINGDTYFEVNLYDMNKFHIEKNSNLTIAEKLMFDYDRYGSIITDIDDRIIKFKEKTYHKSGYINGGIYLISKNILDAVSLDKFSFEQDFMEYNVDERKFYGFKSEQYFIDIGIPQDYFKAQQDINVNKQHKNKALFLDRDGTINVDNGYTHKINDLKFIQGTPQLIKMYNDNGYKVIVVTNQSGIARGYYTVEDMNKFHEHMDLQLKEYGAHVDAYYYCPHHPDINGECKCRKPRTGMIEDAVEDFNIDVKKSILFGDKVEDIEAGISCGISSSLIK